MAINSNQFIKQNYLGFIILLVVVLCFLYFTFGRSGESKTTADNRSFTDSAVATTGEVFRWCVLLDGVNHIPDYFGEGIDNGVGGTDWHSYGNDDPKGPHGVVSENGKKIFFVKKAYLDSHKINPETLALKTSIAGWAPLPMNWANIAGEPALVYVK